MADDGYQQKGPALMDVVLLFIVAVLFAAALAAAMGSGGD